MNIQEWVEDNVLQASIDLPFVVVEGVGRFLLLEDKDCLFDETFSLVLSEKEYELADSIDYLLFSFGSKFYYTDKIEKPELREFKYLGTCNTMLPQIDVPFLGVHGGYDLCNGSRLYDDWCKKAKFLGITTLGIVESNTLAGVISFQKSCEKYDIRSIIGESIRVENRQGERYWVKLYCRDREVGWRNLLRINTEANVVTKGFIHEHTLFKYTEGLVCLLSPEVQLSQCYTDYREHFSELYYQLDFTEWDSQDKDEVWCFNLQEYLDNYRELLKPLLVSDAFYLDKSDSKIQRTLGLIAHSSFRNQSSNQFFKNVDDYLIESIEVLDNEDVAYDLLVESIENTIEVFSGISFKVITGQFYLPKYTMNESESEQFTTNEELLRFYILSGLHNKVVSKGLDVDTYRKRVEIEFDVIKRGGFIDYFLILADIYSYCKKNDIWYGIGRGSAAGCLVSFLCDIVSVDPIKYNLLFERFLNEGRLGKSLPDVDCDFQGERRPEIKRYIEEKYGAHQVTSIGTYGNFKLKSAVKDIARVKGVPPTTLNYVSSLLPSPGQQQPSYYWELFDVAAQKKVVYDFIQQNSELVEEVPLCLNQPKNASIHAAGVVIVPSEFGTIYEQMPVKEQDGVLVSEWEGHFIDDAGFLKVDVLGIQQLDKFASIAKSIKLQTGDEVTFEDIDLDDQDVFELFRQGYNEDVFQLGALGLKAYCKELQPDNIEDLIATVALYRPGPIESGTHKKYIRVKNGFEKPDPDPGCEDITKNTYGLIVYQEQVMQICQHVANFSLVEADDIRKALGKMKPEIVKGYRDTFMERSVSSGYERGKMEQLWSKMEAFAAYAFNRSHAACYAITGYYSQWFKVHYPLQFWVTSLQYAADDERPNRISEIHKTSSITVSPVDINKSDLTFRGDVDTNSIYWALPSVKWVGDKVVESILTEREQNGEFFSLEEFYTRTKGSSGINKRAISHLIISGAFDRVERIGNIVERFSLLERFYNLTTESLKDDYLPMKFWKEYQWVLKQKELTGFGVFDFNTILHQSSFVSKIIKYRENIQILSEDLSSDYYEVTSNKEVVVMGLLENLIERNYKGGKKLAQLEIRDNTDVIFLTIWDEAYQVVRDELKKSIGSIVIVSGDLSFDGYKKMNIVSSNKFTKIEIV